MSKNPQPTDSQALTVRETTRPQDPQNPRDTMISTPLSGGDQQMLSYLRNRYAPGRLATQFLGELSLDPVENEITNADVYVVSNQHVKRAFRLLFEFTRREVSPKLQEDFFRKFSEDLENRGFGV